MWPIWPIIIDVAQAPMRLILVSAVGTSTRPWVREVVTTCLQFRQTNQHRCEFAACRLRLVSVRREGAGVNVPLLDAQFCAGNDSIELLSNHLFANRHADSFHF